MPRRLRKLLGLSKVEDGHGYQAPKQTPTVPSDAAAPLSAEHGAVDGAQTNNTLSHAEDTDGAQDGTLLSGRNATLSQTMAVDSNTTRSLGQPFLYWERAAQQLEDKEPSVFAALQELRKESSCTSKDIPSEISHLIEQHKNTMENKQWSLPFKVRGREVKIRAQLENVWKLLQTFNAVGSTLANLDPVHAGIPWAGVSFIVQGALNDSAQNIAAMDGLSHISLIVDRYLLMETICLGEQELSRHEDLEKRLVDLYAGILEYQVAAACHCKRSTFSRFLRALPKVDDWNAMLQNIDNKDRACKDLVSVFESLELRTQAKRLEIIQSTMQGNEREVTRAANARILSWTCDYVPGRDHQDVMVQKKMGTQYADSGQWLFDHHEFKEWRFRDNDELSTLWVCGAVGTGKTSLVSRVIEWHLQGFQLEPPEEYGPGSHGDQGDQRIRQADPEHVGGIAYFYCVRQGQDQSGTDPIVILRSIVRQLASSLDGSSILPPIRRVYDKLRYERPGSGCLSLEECSELLTELTSYYSNTTIILDALDECEKPYELLRALKRVAHSRTDQIKLFVSSRLNVHVDSVVILHRKIDIQSQGASKDMAIFLHREVKQRDSRLLKGRYPELEDRLIEVLRDRAQGMFRWAELQMAMFLDENSPFRLAEDVISKLDRLNEEVGLPDLDLVYDEIYRKNTRVGTHDRENVLKIFSFLLYSFVEWKIRDLATAISLGIDGTLNMAVDASYVLDICSNFLVVDHSKHVQFAHLSVAEYLKGGRAGIVFSAIDAHARIAEVCLAYVMSPSAQETVTKREINRRYRNINVSDPVPSSQENYIPTVDSYYEQMSTEDPLDLHLYAFLLCLEHCELASMVKRQEGTLCRLFTSFMSMVENNAPLLTWIPRMRNRAIIALEHPRNWTIQIDFDDCQNKRRHVRADPQDTFFAACAYGFTEIIRNMRSVVNVHVSRRNRIGAPGICVASRYGHLSVVELLLDGGAESDIKNDRYGFTPLYEAVVGVHPDIVALLLSRGADANARFKEYYGYYLESVDDNDDYDKEDDKDPEDHENNKVNRVDETLLHAIGRECREAKQESKIPTIVSLLLKHGVSIEAVDSRLRTPLHIACSDYELLPVSTLLHHGAFPGALDEGGYTPLMYTSFSGPSDALQLLLTKASISDIVCRNSEALSVLSLSLSNYNPDSTILLLNTVDLGAAQELGTQEGDEFVELSQILKRIGYVILDREWPVLSSIASRVQSQRPVINCLRAIAEKVDLGKLDWDDTDLRDMLRKEGFDLGLRPVNTACLFSDMTVPNVDGTVARPLRTGKRVRFVGIDE